MKYLKYFTNESDYQTFKDSEDYVLPNVSYVENSDIVMYNPYVEPASPNLVCTYNVTDISQETQILASYGLGCVTNMIINGVEMEAETYYQFGTVGNHVVEFVLDDPTIIGIDAFSDCSSLTSVTIPDSVTSINNGTFDGCTSLTSIMIPDSITSIGDGAFQDCTNLTSITIPDSVTSIGGGAFGNCTSLTSVTIGNSVTSINPGAFSNCTNLNEITCFATTAPSIQNGTFANVKQNGILKVPAGSDYSSWVITDPVYLGYYNWTIEYI